MPVITAALPVITPAIAAPATPVVAPAAPVVAPVAPVVAPVAPVVAPGVRPVITPAIAPPGAPAAGPMITPVLPPASAPLRAPPRPPGAPGSAPPQQPPRPPGAPGAAPGSRPPAPIPPVAPPPAAPVITAGVMVSPPAAAAPPAPGLGEFDPFASESVKAIVGPPPAAAPGAAPAAAAPAPIPQTTAMPPPAFPETGAIEAVTPPIAMALAQIVGVLSDVDYFQVLRISYEATVPEIKKAFYRESRTYHPDRFFHLSDDDVKADISTVYKRITEAYYFLKDDTKRKKYLADLAGAERKAKLRFTEASEVETKQLQKKEQEEQIGTHPKGRQLYATALKDIDAKRFSDAQRNLKSALMYERDNARYKEKLAEVEQRLVQEFKDKGQQFKIR